MFTKDSRTEVFLTTLGADFRYSNKVTFADMESGWDAKNLARPKVKREDSILEYAALMEGGSPAPAPILAEVNGQLSVLDGIQRLCAEQLTNSTTFSAYVVTTDSEDMLDNIRLLANIRLQGRQEPAEWTRRNAVEFLVIQKGRSPEEVARLGGWSPSDITRLAKLMDFGFHIRCIGGPELTDTVCEAISRHASKEHLRRYQKPIAEFLNVLKDGRFSGEDAEPLLQEFFALTVKSSHEVYTERLGKILERPDVQARINGRRSYTIPADVKLRRALKAVQGIVDELTEEPLYVDEFFKMLKKIDSGLKKLSRHSPKPDVPRVPADKWSRTI